jgi:hypothetical protein
VGYAGLYQGSTKWPSSPADRRFDPNGNSIAPPVSGGQPVNDEPPADPLPPPADVSAPPADDPAKIARLGLRRARHAGD